MNTDEKKLEMVCIRPKAKIGVYKCILLYTKNSIAMGKLMLVARDVGYHRHIADWWVEKKLGKTDEWGGVLG